MNKIVFLCCVSLMLLACGGGQKASDGTSAAPAATAPAASHPVLYPSVAPETVKMLWDKCDYIDFVFYYLNFSMSQKEPQSIKGTIAHISADVPGIDPNCKPIGRLFFQSEGKNVLEADIFYSNGCAYYIFYEDGKYAYANKMMPAGAQFFDNIFKQVEAQQKQ